MTPIDFNQILEAKHAGDREALNEKSLGRVYQHVKNSDIKSFGIVTSYRSSNPKQKNIATFGELQAAVRSAGLGFNKLQGHWQECQDSGIPYDKCPKDQLVDAAEPSLFISGIALDMIQMLSNKYDQDAFVYSGPETGGKVTLFFRDGSKQPIGEFSPHKIAQAYSQLKGKNFVFEYVAQSHMESLIEQEFKRGRK